MCVLNAKLTLLDYELIIVDLIYAAPVLQIQVVVAAYPDPCAALAAAVPQHVSTVIRELYLCMLLAELRRLNVHSQIYLLGVARAEELPIRGRVDEEEFSAKDAVSAFEQIVVVALLACSLMSVVNYL